ncbi:OmpH family outer membrane protein, partial [bacterium]|nr:OmpH family outer membrane protein [candidate division CSSED10-310 bacterium]
MKRTAMIFVAALCVIASVGDVWAQEMKIGFIHTQKVILETKAGKDGYAKLEQLVEEYKRQIQQKEAEIKAMEDELAKQGKMLSEEARLEKREELQKVYKDYTRLKEDAKT